MKKFIPTIIVLLVSLVVAAVAFTTKYISQADFAFLGGASIFFTLLNFFASQYLQKAPSGPKSITRLMAVSGVIMISFLVLLFSYNPSTQQELTIMIALILFIIYLAFKMALFLPIVRTPQ